MGEGGRAEPSTKSRRSSLPTRAPTKYLRQNNASSPSGRWPGRTRKLARDRTRSSTWRFAPEKASDSDVKWKWISVHDPRRRQGQVAHRRGRDGGRTRQPVTKDKFKDFKLHIELQFPHALHARGARAKAAATAASTFQGRYEIQVLDSYGLEGGTTSAAASPGRGADGEHVSAASCSGRPTTSRSMPPDSTRAATKTADAVVTVVHNGVTIHNRRKLPRPDRRRD